MGRARTAVVLALGLGLGLTGCSSDTPTGDVTVDAKAGLASSVAPPGRYRTLFEACGAVPQATLKEMLPSAAGLPDADRERAYRGTAAVTYDTGRRVGCTWKADTREASHRLSLDIERVVSYDTAVSDDDRAQEVYVRKQLAAGIPLPPTAPPQTTAPAGTPSGGPATATPPAHKPPATGGTGAGAPPTASVPQGPAAPTTGPAPSGSPAVPAPPSSTGLESRVLDGLGDVAYLDDASGEVGANGRQRSVSVVFRTSNVIVTVFYRAEATGSPEAPDSGELQEKARNLARLLAERLNE